MAKHKKKKANVNAKRIRALTNALVVFHRYSEGWTDKNQRYADVFFKTLVGSDALEGALADIATQSAIGMPRNWEIQINVYCLHPNGDRYTESSEFGINNFILLDLEAHIEAVMLETIEAVNEKQWYDKEWIATPQAAKPINWDSIGKKVNAYIRRKDANNELPKMGDASNSNQHCDSNIECC
ncbi:MAG: hypothetical protein JKY09_09600 [Crocinitomicaceae bacterium]|nr:hypothetical protein [Crocinitomicaceae bacterium]